MPFYCFKDKISGEATFVHNTEDELKVLKAGRYKIDKTATKGTYSLRFNPGFYLYHQ
ncbi:hypothetical protein GCM10008986_21420 [Salinibacillus aidingensis]|uniref:Uncharacterized protein n=2 Tax=Salinibacillus aidingensis TaxID=237684 RepID=A0ABN1BBY7_9BACI